MKKYTNKTLLLLLLIAFTSLFAEDTFTPGKAKVTASVLNVRNIASVGGVQVGSVKRGDLVEVIDRSKNQSDVDGVTDYWYKINLPEDKKGWVFGGFLTFELNLEKGLKWKNEIPAAGEIFTGIAVSPDKSILVGTTSGVLYQSKDGGKTWKKMVPQALGNSISSIKKIITSGKDIWIISTGATDAGGGAWKTTNYGSSWSQYTKAQGLPSNVVNDIFIGSDKKIWLATSKGICFSDTDGSSWKSVDNFGLKGEPLSLLAIDNNLLLAGTTEGIFKHEEGKLWTLLNSKLNVNIETLSRMGNIIFAGTEKGLAKSDISKLTDWKMIGGSSIVKSIFIDKNDRIVVASNNGLNISLDKGESWVTYKKEHGLASNAISSIAIDEAGMIWVSLAGAGVGHHE